VIRFDFYLNLLRAALRSWYFPDVRDLNL